MDKFEEAYAQLNVAQKRAVDALEGPVLVIAGPGTGKTQLLAVRIANILAKTDASAANILCLTFTDSAAQTMRERLSSFIGQDAYDVTISTYHAFGSDLIRRFPDYFAELGDLQPVDALGIDTILREIVTNLPYASPLKFSDNYLNDIKTLISDAKRTVLTPQDLRAVAAQNQTYIAAANPIVAKALGSVVRLNKKDIPKFKALSNQLAPLVTQTPAAARVVPIAQLLLADLHTALDAAAELGDQTPLTKWKNTWLAKDDQGNFVVDGARAARKLDAAADIYESYLQELATRGLYDYDDMILHAVRALQTHADLRYTLQEQYLYLLLDEFQDTNGAQLKLVELLTDNPVNEDRPNVLAVGDDDQAIYAFQGANYSHMLQFQQMYRDVLLVPLTKNYRSHKDILQLSHGIAQQIEERLHHRFPAIEKVLESASKTLPSKAVIERREAKSDVSQFAWVADRIHQLIAAGTPASEIAVLAPQHKYLEPLVAFLQQAKIPVRYEKRENVLDDPAITQLLRMSELCLALTRNDHATADSLWPEVLSFAFWNLPTSLIWQLSWQANDNDRNWSQELLDDPGLKPLALFFIRLSHLTTSETLETLLDYLIGAQPLDLQEPGFQNFRSPFFAFYFNEGSISAATVSSPQVAFTRGELPFEPRVSKDQLSPSSSSSGKALQTRPSKENLDSHWLSSGSTMGRVTTWGDDTVAAGSVIERKLGDNFWGLLTNLIVLRTRLREYRRDKPGPLKLADLIVFVQAHRAANIKIQSTSPYQEAAEAVQLMTAFKAKGQEYAAVFLLAVNDEAWGSKVRHRSSFLSIPANLQFIRYVGATDDERLRLLYVAVTRAKSQLYLVNYTNNYAGKILTRLKYLNETVGVDGAVTSPLLSKASQLVLPAEAKTAAPTAELAAYWQQRHQRALSRKDVANLLRGRLEQLQFSPTHLNDYTDIVDCGPEAFFLKTILRFPEAPSPHIQFGNAMHETLEWLHGFYRREGRLPELKIVSRTFEKHLLAKRLSEQQTSLLLARGNQSLVAYLQQRAATITTDNECEYNFRNEGVFVGPVHVSGKIDKLIIDRINKTITIVDFKTGRAYRRWEHVIKLHKYEQQLYFYKLLVEGSHRFAGYTVTNAYVEFIEPDEQSEIVELHIVFDADKMKRLRRLIAIIWEQIKNLKLADSSQYHQSYAGIVAFEQALLDHRAPHANHAGISE